MIGERQIRRGFLIVAPILAAAAMSVSAASPTPLTTTRVASGLSLPLFVTAPPGDTTRVFILEQRSGTTGRIRILDIPGNFLIPTPFLSISPVTTSDEQGLLGLAFDPDYATNGFFYVCYTTTCVDPVPLPGCSTVGGAGGQSVLARYTVSTHVPGHPSPDPNIADPASRVVMLQLNQPETNHNGGCLQFGPDGMLYLAFGDGGGGGDVHGTIGNGQDLTTLLGKMLRLDEDLPPKYIPADNPSVGGSPVDEKWAFGLRNPWRYCFDRANGDLYLADVGQGSVEEVNYSTFATAPGRNYAWRCMEGNACFTSPSGPNCTCDTTPPLDPTLTYPVHTYSSAGVRPCSVTGGYVYRGPLIPDLQGTYFFADYFCSGTLAAPIWSFIISGGAVTNFTDRTAELAPGGGLVINSITSFGEDANGELYICDRGTGANGEVFKIIVSCAGSSISVTDQPDSQTVDAGDPIILTVAASGLRGLTTYSWRRDGQPVGINNSTLQINNALCHDQGNYDCVITDQCGSITSDIAVVSVTPAASSPVPGDIDFDLDLDLDDLTILIDVLVGVDTDAGHVSRSDINGIDCENGSDIQPFLDLMFP